MDPVTLLYIELAAASEPYSQAWAAAGKENRFDVHREEIVPVAQGPPLGNGGSVSPEE